MKKIKCYNCQHEMKSIKTDIKCGWGDYALTINGVKGFVCPDCGAKMYAPEEIEMVENIGKALAESKEPEKPDYLNVTETADLLRVSNQTVYNLIKSNKIKAVKFGREWRFLRKNIESLINDDIGLAARTGSFDPSDQEIINNVRQRMKDE